MLLRKAAPGSDSFGNVWRAENSVVEVPEDQAALLLAIPDAGFSVVDVPDDDPELTEPAPAAAAHEVADASGPGHSKRTGGRGRRSGHVEE